MARWLVFTVSTGGYDLEGSEPALPAGARQGAEWIRLVDSLSFSLLASRASLWRTVLLDASHLSPPLPPSHYAPSPPASSSLASSFSSSLPLTSLALPQNSSHLSAESARRLSREIKIRPHRFSLVWRYEISLYLDSNVRVVQPLSPLFRLASTHDLAAYDFPRPLDAEAAWVRRFLTTKDPRFTTAAAQEWLNRTLADQVGRYKRKGDHMWNRTVYGKVILRRHTKCVHSFGEIWWQEYSSGVPRDQLSFRYSSREAARQCGLRVHFGQHHKGRLAGFR
ncbi:MAG: hypothetical protein SGPRY_003530 [Prymnesium sp.]